MVKAETGLSIVTAATGQDNEIYQVIFDVQNWLASEYDWPFLQLRWDAAVVAGDRVLNFPTTTTLGTTASINFERPVRTFTKWANRWHPVTVGIDEMPELNTLDPDTPLLRRQDPILKWQFSDETQFEIWPMAAGSQTLRFIGQRAVTELRSSVGPPPVWDATKTLDLDDLLVTHFAAAEYFARREKPEKAQLSMKLAQDRLERLRAVYPNRTSPPCVIGRGMANRDRKLIKAVPIVTVA